MSKSNEKEENKNARDRGIIGEKLQDIRKSKGFTLAELAILTKIPKSTLSKYENGHMEPKMIIINKILDNCGSSIAEFADIADYDSDLKVFERYGLSENFLIALLFDEFFKKHNKEYCHIAEIIDILFEVSFSADDIFQNLNLFFDYELNKELGRCINKDASVVLADGNNGRIFLNPIAKSLVEIFTRRYMAKDIASFIPFLDEQAKKNPAIQELIEAYLELSENLKKPTDAL